MQMGAKQKLDVVNEQGDIIRQETREKIHTDGLLHREVHVWFYTSKGEIIFQHRAKDKDTFPDLLDATVGGHVEIGMDEKETALKETEEETGIKVRKSDLVLIGKTRHKVYDPVTKMTNNTILTTYAYRYGEDISALRVEEGKAIGFETWPFEKILNLDKSDRKRFIHTCLGEKHQNIPQNIFRKIQRLSKK